MTETAVKVLIVEDDEDDYIYTKHLLNAAKDQRYDVQWADRLEAAINYLGSLHIDVVLLDLSLPDSFGWDTFTTVRRHAPDVAVILLTGVQDEELGTRAVHAGAQDYLIKGGLSTALLCRSIRYAIERRRAQDALRTAYGDLQGVIGQSRRDLEATNRQLLVETARRDRAERALHESRRLEAVCAFVDHTSQRFGALLSHIRLKTAHMERHGEGNAGAEHRASITEAVEHAMSMNERLARVAQTRRGDARIEDANLAALVQHVTARTRDKAMTRGVSVRFDPGGGIPRVRADTQQLEELVQLFVDGADQVLPSGGDLWLQLTDVGAWSRPDRGSGTCAAKRYVTLDVLYDHLTMNADAIDLLLPSLAGSDGWGQGDIPPGLGFIVMRSRVRGWGGDAEIIERTEKGGGVRIYFEAGTSEASIEDLPASSLAVGHGVLVVDDDEKDLAMIGQALEAAGYRVLLARSGKDGIMHLRAKQSVAVVVIDAVMPDRGGHHLLHAVRVAIPDAAVVVTSGFSRDYVQSMLRDRNWKYIQKPFDSAAVVETVDGLVRGRFARPASA